MFPDRLEILDFYHLCEYIWSLAKIYYSAEKTQAEQWAEEQLERLKNSESNLVFEELKFIEKIGGTKELLEETEKVLSYLESNKDRIDYKSYLSQGLMIGSGVIESSNKVVVTNRMKHGGMHWSKEGAQSIMSLRALYCSDRQEWNDFWLKKCS